MVDKRRRFGGFLASALLFAVLLVGAVVQLAREDDDAPDLVLEAACDQIEPDDSAEEVFATLGVEGYKPGCGVTLPCLTLTLGNGSSVEYACEGDDCSLLWRSGASSCSVEMGPDLVVSSASSTRVEF